jgi:hypothetical protein
MCVFYKTRNRLHRYVPCLNFNIIFTKWSDENPAQNSPDVFILLLLLLVQSKNKRIMDVCILQNT